jgi:hypothetical protein
MADELDAFYAELATVEAEAKQQVWFTICIVT